MKKYLSVFCIMVISIFCVSVINSNAQSSEDLAFYNGKTLRIIIPHGPGGGYDMYARMAAPYLTQYLPGCNIVIASQPGAGGVIGRNMLYAAKPNGLTIGLTNAAGSFLSEWAEQKGIKHEAAKFTWIAGVYSEPALLVVSAKTKYRSINDIIAAGKLQVGYSGVGSEDYYYSILALDAMKVKVDAVTGYKGTHESMFGVVRGEIEANHGSYGSLRPIIESGDAIPIYVMKYERMKEFPNVPTILELLKGEDRKDFDACVGMLDLSRVVFGPPDMHKGRLAVLRDAFKKLFNDPKFLADCEKNKRPVAYLSSAELEQRVEFIKNAEKRLKGKIKEIGERKFQ